MSDRPGPAEVFSSALAAFRDGELPQAVADLRRGFFENLYVAPILLGEEYEPQPIWYPSPQSRPEAAEQYAFRFGKTWERTRGAIRFLAEVWSDSLVFSEVRNFINLSKAIQQSRDDAQRVDLLREWELFVDPRRILHTQTEIVSRLQRSGSEAPWTRPRVALVLLASRDPTATVAFYRALFGIEPIKSSRRAGGYAEFDLPGVRIAIHGHDRLATGDPYGLGPPPESFGWGAIFVLRVREFDRYHENAERAGIEILDRDLESDGARFFVVRDPSGYVLEITEEPEPQGL